MKCANCGNELDCNVKFCTFCGVSVDAGSPVAATPSASVDNNNIYKVAFPVIILVVMIAVVVCAFSFDFNIIATAIALVVYLALAGVLFSAVNNIEVLDSRPTSVTVPVAPMYTEKPVEPASPVQKEVPAE